MPARKRRTTAKRKPAKRKTTAKKKATTKRKPAKRKTAKGMPRFLSNWLARAQNAGRANGASTPASRSTLQAWAGAE